MVKLDMTIELLSPSNPDSTQTAVMSQVGAQRRVIRKRTPGTIGYDFQQLVTEGLCLSEMQSVQSKATCGVSVVGLHGVRSLGHLATVAL